MASVELATAFVQLVPSARGMEAGIAREMGAPAAAAGATSGSKFGGAFKKTATVGALAGAAAFGKGLMDFTSFEASMNEVFTLIPDLSQSAYNDMSEQAKKFAAETGTRLADVPTPLYDALSAGVPPDNVFAFLEDANRFAKAGAVDLATAVDGLTSGLNAFGLEASETERVSDALFTAVKLGKTTVGELSSSLFQVAPVAAAFGVSIEDVSAGFATLTAQGTPTSVAATQMKSAIAELGKEGTKASKAFTDLTGKSFTKFIEEGGTLVDVAGIMSAGADDLGISIVDMFGSIEAGQAVLGLASDLENAQSNLDAVANGAGATQVAFEQMEKGLKPVLDKLRARFDVILVNLGEALAPVITAIGGGLATLVEMFTKLPGPVQTAIIALATLSAGAVAFGAVFVKMAGAIKGVSAAFTLLSANPWFLVAAGVIALAVLIVKNWDSIKAALVKTWEFIKSTVTAVFNAIKDFFVQWWPALLVVFTGPIGVIVALVVQNWDTIKNKTVEIWNAITGWIGDRIDNIKSFIGGLVDKGSELIGFFTSLPGYVSAAWNGIVEFTANAINRLIQLLSDLKSRALDALGPLGNIANAAGGFIGGGLRLLGFSTGGVVPGPKGAPQLVVAHGGETIIPTHRNNWAAQMSGNLATFTPTAVGAPVGATPVVAHLHVYEPVNFQNLERESTELVRVVNREINRNLAAVGRTGGAR
jgi:TP901 family phage tail tape measure protein